MTPDQQYNHHIATMKHARAIIDHIDPAADHAILAGDDARARTLWNRAKTARRAYNNAAEAAAHILRTKSEAQNRYKDTNATRLYRYTYLDFVYTEASQ